MLTKAEALNKLNEIKRNSQHNGYMLTSDVEDLFCKIYDEYEAQFKEFNKIVEETHFQNEQEHKIQLKAKDEEIERLNCRAYHAEGYINDLHNSPKVKKFYDKKARSIVAMLFWEWKSGIKYIESQYDKGIVEGMRYSFHKAYKMIKDNQ